MWWTFAAALAGPSPEASLEVVLDHQAATRARVRAARRLGRLDPTDPEARRVVTPLAGGLQTELPERLPPVIRRTLSRLDATAVWTDQLSSEDPEARERAATLLGREGTAAAGDALVASLGDATPAVREAAADALVAYPEADSVGALARALGDPVVEVRLAASQTLGFLGSDDARDALAAARRVEDDALVMHYLDAAMQHIDLKQSGQADP